MKNRIAILFVLFCLVQFACKKSENPAMGVSVQPNNKLDTLVAMNAKVNGVNWQTDSVNGYNVLYTNDSGRLNLFITATQKQGDTSTTISFTLTNYLGPATYTVSPPLNSAAYYVGNTRHMATSGQVVVVTDTNYAITGTFNFIADSITVTQGVFNVEKP